MQRVYLDARIQATQLFMRATNFGHTWQEYQHIAFIFCIECPLDRLYDRRLKSIALVPWSPMHLDVEGAAAAFDHRRWIGLADQRRNLGCINGSRHDHHRCSQVERSLRIEQQR
jgi:hypothetical protein